MTVPLKRMSPTLRVVGCLIGTALGAAAFQIFGWSRGAFAVAVGAYEGWTLVNGYPNDTLSEAFWELAAKYAMVPWLFGVAGGVGIVRGWFENDFAVASWFFLMGHFFCQSRGQWFRRVVTRYPQLPLLMGTVSGVAVAASWFPDQFAAALWFAAMGRLVWQRAED